MDIQGNKKDATCGNLRKVSVAGAKSMRPRSGEAGSAGDDLKVWVEAGHDGLYLKIQKMTTTGTH